MVDGEGVVVCGCCGLGGLVRVDKPGNCCRMLVGRLFKGKWFMSKPIVPMLPLASLSEAVP